MQWFKVLCPVLAQRADEIRRERFAFVNIAADFAHKALLLFGSRLRLGLDVGEIVSVRYGRLCRKHMRLGYVRNEQRVRAAIHRGDHLAGDHGVRMLGKVCNAVFRARLAAGKLIRRAPALKTVLFEQAERCAFREHGMLNAPVFSIISCV